MPERAHKPPAERILEQALFKARWMMAPFYVGLALVLIVLLVVFVGELVHDFTRLGHLGSDDAILLALSLIDLSLAANLLLIVIFAGYENFVSKFDLGQQDRPSWMGTVDFSGMKLKLIASIVAISAIALLRSFLQLGEGEAIDQTKLFWMLVIHVTFVVSGVLLAVMDLVSSKTDKH